MPRRARRWGRHLPPQYTRPYRHLAMTRSHGARQCPVSGCTRRGLVAVRARPQQEWRPPARAP
eukprot:1196409-Prorocentrum_minimum.AAC.1